MRMTPKMKITPNMMTAPKMKMTKTSMKLQDCEAIEIKSVEEVSIGFERNQKRFP